jgi:hypothetical protein
LLVNDRLNSFTLPRVTRNKRFDERQPASDVHILHMRLSREEDSVFFESGIECLVLAPHHDTVKLEPDIVPLRSRPTTEA